MFYTEPTLPFELRRSFERRFWRCIFFAERRRRRGLMVEGKSILLWIPAPEMQTYRVTK